MRKEYVLTQDQFDVIMDACKPVLMIALHCGDPGSPQENANRAWVALGKDMGFDGMTVKPVAGKSQLFVTAESQ